ncbi:MAG: hypothetical protein IJZ61_08145 [Oscillospiraceae bacterium]|nr:hypothetical protein [Oscillospiraceae bacterium]
MKKLYIVEGLPCSGKSTTSAFIAEELKKKYKVCYVDEGTGNHPADYEFHAFLSNTSLQNFNEAEQANIKLEAEKKCDGYIVPISAFCGDLFKKLLQFKVYDFLPWETEYPIMLEKWRSFTDCADDSTVYVFNCVLLQNPMCETMMRFNFPIGKSQEYIKIITEIIKPLNPVVIYLKNDDIRSSVEKAAKERSDWLDGVIDYHISGAYGKSINAQGYEGYISCLEERQKRELEILSQLDIESVVIDNPHRDWNNSYEVIKEYIL